MTATRMRRSVDSMSGRLKAILLMCAAVTLFACLDANAKYLGSHFKMPVAEIVWTRFVGQFLLMVALLGPRAVPGLFKTQKFGLQIVRSFLMAATTVCNFIAVQYLRLDQTISIAFLAPLVVALLAGPLLGEYVGWRRALAIVTGFIGILDRHQAGLCPNASGLRRVVAAMLAYALFMIVTRKLSGFDTPFVTLFYSLLVGVVGGALFAIPQWVWPSNIFECLLLLTLGALGGLGHYLLILAYRLAPASSVSPFLYFQLLSMVSSRLFRFRRYAGSMVADRLCRRHRLGPLSCAPRARRRRCRSRYRSRAAGGFMMRAFVAAAHSSKLPAEIASRIAAIRS